MDLNNSLVFLKLFSFHNYKQTCFLKEIFFFYWRIISLQCLAVSAVHQRKSTIIMYVYPLPAIPSLQGIAARQAVLYSSFALVNCFIFGSVYMAMLLSQFVMASLPPTVSMSLFSTSASLFLLCKQVHQYYFFQIPYICVNI